MAKIPLLYLKVICILFLCFPMAATSCHGQSGQLDFLGDSHYSWYNFTDLVVPYYGLDSWVESRVTYWINDNKRWAPYGSVLASNMSYIPQANDSIPFFDWQRYVQFTVGGQFYPFFGEDYNPSFGLRLFLLGAYRLYYSDNRYSRPETDFVCYDLHLGGDYYYDNIFCDDGGWLCERQWLISVWANATLRQTNFNKKHFNNFLFSGNLKFGKRLRPYKNGLVFPYLATDISWIPLCGGQCNWFQNYIHFGTGVRLYPYIINRLKEPSSVVLRRLHIYVEGWHEGIWLQGQSPEVTHEWDLRYGVGFSTPGIFRKKNKERSYEQLYD
jgi:hypothetical protein